MNLTQAFQIKTGENIALVGGGGKSSTMFKLGQELAQKGDPVLLTSTTRIFAAQIKLAPAYISFDPNTQSFSDLVSALENALNVHKQVLLIGAIDHNSGKALGISPQLIDDLAKTHLFTVIINEADGSRMRPFKAPAEHEPVIPNSTTLVVPVVGLDILNQPLNDVYVHRAKLVSELSQKPLETPISPAMIATILTHPEGGLKNVPCTARVIPLLNKHDLFVSGDFGGIISELATRILTSSQIDSVVIGAVTHPNPIIKVENRVAAIVLAAGGASRFGSTKQLALWQGKPLLTYAVDAALASKAKPVIVVLGAEAESCQMAIADRPVEIIVNDAWQEGQSTSIKVGLKALSPFVSAAIFPLADQPLIKAQDIDTIIAHYQQTLAPVVWPTFKGKRGNPVLFDKRLFSEIDQLAGDVGAKLVLQAYQNQAEQVAIANIGILKDVDRPEDLQAL